MALAAAGRRHQCGPASMPVGSSFSVHVLTRLPLSYIRLLLLELIRLPGPARGFGFGPLRRCGPPIALARGAREPADERPYE